VQLTLPTLYREIIKSSNDNTIIYLSLPISKIRYLLTSRILLRATKTRQDTPVLLYGGEAWTLKKKDAETLSVFERRILRRIFGGVFENSVWRIRTNRELVELFDFPNVLEELRAKRSEDAFNESLGNTAQRITTHRKI